MGRADELVTAASSTGNTGNQQLWAVRWSWRNMAEGRGIWAGRSWVGKERCSGLGASQKREQVRDGSGRSVWGMWWWEVLECAGELQEQESLSLRGMKPLGQEGLQSTYDVQVSEQFSLGSSHICLILFPSLSASILSHLQNTEKGWIPLNTSPLTWTFFLHDTFLLFWWSRV